MKTYDRYDSVAKQSGFVECKAGLTSLFLKFIYVFS